MPIRSAIMYTSFKYGLMINAKTFLTEDEIENFLDGFHYSKNILKLHSAGFTLSNSDNDCYLFLGHELTLYDSFNSEARKEDWMQEITKLDYAQIHSRLEKELSQINNILGEEKIKWSTPCFYSHQL